MNCSMEWRGKENLGDPEDQSGVAIFNIHARKFTYRASSFDNAQYVRRLIDCALYQGGQQVAELIYLNLREALENGKPGGSTQGDQS